MQTKASAKEYEQYIMYWPNEDQKLDSLRPGSREMERGRWEGQNFQLGSSAPGRRRISDRLMPCLVCSSVLHKIPQTPRPVGTAALGKAHVQHLSAEAGYRTQWPGHWLRPTVAIPGTRRDTWPACLLTRKCRGPDTASAAERACLRTPWLALRRVLLQWITLRPTCHWQHWP